MYIVNIITKEEWERERESKSKQKFGVSIYLKICVKENEKKINMFSLDDKVEIV